MKREDIISTLVEFADNSSIDIDSELYRKMQEAIFCIWVDNIQDNEED